jgi:hypothetical protein
MRITGEARRARARLQRATTPRVASASTAPGSGNIFRSWQPRSDHDLAAVLCARAAVGRLAAVIYDATSVITHVLLRNMRRVLAMMASALWRPATASRPLREDQLSFAIGQWLT